MTLGLVERLKSSDLILESKMVELNQNKKSQQPGWPDSVWKLYFILEINLIQHNCLHVVYKMVFLRKIVKKAPDKLATYEKLIYKFCGSIYHKKNFQVRNGEHGSIIFHDAFSLGGYK